MCNKKKPDQEIDELAETSKDSKDPKVEENRANVTPPPEDADNERKAETLCPLLAVGECPHGISGRGCSYKHPKWCWKYQKYGNCISSFEKK